MRITANGVLLIRHRIQEKLPDGSYLNINTLKCRTWISKPPIKGVIEDDSYPVIDAVCHIWRLRELYPSEEDYKDFVVFSGNLFI